jgi:hypothetical protein
VTFCVQSVVLAGGRIVAIEATIWLFQSFVTLQLHQQYLARISTATDATAPQVCRTYLLTGRLLAR